MRNMLFFAALTATVLFAASCMTEASLTQLDRYRPDPSLDPGRIVEIQLEALRNNDDQNRGIEIAFRFASPRNREMTGPLARFILLLYTPPFRPLLDAAVIEYGEVIVRERIAFQPVVLTDESGTESRYLFILVRQTVAPYEECWMVEGVRPVAPEERNEDQELLVA